MFGFSIQKLLFTILVVALVWYGFKWLARVQERRAEGGGGAKAPSRRKRDRAAPADAVEDMVACGVCGTFVAQRGARSCGRGDCPYPG